MTMVLLNKPPKNPFGILFVDKITRMYTRSREDCIYLDFTWNGATLSSNSALDKYIYLVLFIKDRIIFLA
jgi:hypothetical protein